MLDDLFTGLSIAMSDRFEIALAAALAWGIASVLLSPCHLASIPLIIGYLVRGGAVGAWRTIGLSTTFAVGLLMSVAVIGLITASLGRMMGDVGVVGNVIVAAVFFLVGLSLMDVITLSWNPLPLRPVKGKPSTGALVLGLISGIGLGPCTFAYLAPVLALVFGLASTSMTSAVLLIAAFSAGHCIVIVAAGSLAHAVQSYLNWAGRSRGATWVKRGAGMLVVLAGVYFIYTAF